MSEILEKIKKQVEEINEKRAKLIGEVRKDFPTLLKPLFDKSKKINSIGFQCYTPYFADGDECVYGVYYDYLIINGIHEDDLEWLDWRIGYYLEKGEYKNEIENNLNLDIEEYKIVQEFKEVLKSIPDDFYKDLFGDHVEVTIYKNGNIKTSSHDHD